jgi:hypothetical protein
MICAAHFAPALTGDTLHRHKSPAFPTSPALSLRAFGVTGFATAKVKDFGNFDFERFGIHGLSQLDRLRAVDRLLTTGMWIQADGNVLMSGAGIASPADTLPGHLTPTPGRGLRRLWDPGLQPAP